MTKIWKRTNLTSETSLKAVSALGCLFLSGWSCKAAQKAILTKQEKQNADGKKNTFHQWNQPTKLMVLLAQNFCSSIFFHLHIKSMNKKLLHHQIQEPQKRRDCLKNNIKKAHKQKRKTYSKNVIPINERWFNKAATLSMSASNGTCWNGANLCD